MSRSHPESFSQDFRRFFIRGLAALLPTFITLWLLIRIWSFLWGSLGQYLVMGIGRAATAAGDYFPASEWIRGHLDWFGLSASPPWFIELFGVLLALVLIYSVGLFVGHFLGRTSWRLAETLVRRIPLIRAIYPAVKQVTDFVLSERQHLLGSRVVAVEPHAKGIWSIGLVTGTGVSALSGAVGKEMVTVFVPSSPTAFSGYVLVVPRESVIELPLTVEQAMRLLVSGGVVGLEASELKIEGAKG